MSDQKSGPVSVLVIDDNDVDRALIRELLAQAGFDVHDLPSPIGATRTARELQVKVVVIDQNLPSLNGNKLAALFRNVTGLQKELRIILVSGEDEITMLSLAQAARADAFVSKRDLHAKLVPTVRRLARG